MPRTYNLFISHAWQYNDDYYTVVNWLSQSSLDYRNYSVPQHDPLDVRTNAGLENALTNQIKPASIVIIIAGMYDAYSKWIGYEIDEAKRMGKTIIGIRPRGQQRIPLKVQQAATEMVGWNSSSLINAIMRY